MANALADYLARQHELGVLDTPQPRVSAEQFFGMVLGQIHVRLMLGLSDAAPGPDEREQVVALAVRTFLHGTSRSLRRLRGALRAPYVPARNPPHRTDARCGMNRR